MYAAGALTFCRTQSPSPPSTIIRHKQTRHTQSTNQHKDTKSKGATYAAGALTVCRTQSPSPRHPPSPGKQFKQTSDAHNAPISTDALNIITAALDILTILAKFLSMSLLRTAPMIR
jgi:hypothetical protein